MGEDNVIKLALEEDEEEEKAETAEEEERDELSISKESPKVETRALRNRTKAEAVTPKMTSKRRHRDEEEVEEVEPPKRRSTRQRPGVDYCEDGNIISPPVTLSSGAKPTRQSTKGKRASRGREESSSDEEQEKISSKVETRALQNRTKAEAVTPKMKSKRRHRDEEEVEEVEPPKRRSTRQRPEVDYSEDGDIIRPSVTLSSGAKPRRERKH